MRESVTSAFRDAGMDRLACPGDVLRQADID